MTEEVERLKLRVHEHEKLLRECEALKVSFNCQFHNKFSCLYTFLNHCLCYLFSVQAQVAMLVKRVTELELLH